MAKLPFSSSPEESFQVTIFESLYNMRHLWNTLGFWTLDIDDENGESLATGVKLVSGVFLLSQYPQIRFDIKSDSLLADPGRDDVESFSFEVSNKDV